MYEALRRGTIDGAECNTPVLDARLGLHEASKYVCGPSWWQTANNINFSVNLETWNSLPDDLKAIVEYASRATDMERSTAYEYENIKALEEIEARVEFVSLDAESQDLISGLLHEAILEECEANPDFARLWDSMVTYMKDMIPDRAYQYPYDFGYTPAWLTD